MVQGKAERRKVNRYQTEVYGNLARKNAEQAEYFPGEQADAGRSQRKRRQQAETLSIPYCIFLTVASVLTLVLGAYYLQQQALSTSQMKKIASLETELTEMKKVNADELNRIEASVNLEEIRDIAVNELGMVYATKENVVLYENVSQNYVNQYEEVPEEEETLIKSIIKSK